MRNATAEDIIKTYSLSPHPEGGFYSRTYTSPISITYRGSERPVCTAILFLLRGNQYSRLHLIPQDEMWHFYLGSPLRLVMITSDGKPHEIILGQEIISGQKLQFNVPGGSWFGATPVKGGAYSLVGCTVAPGFCMGELLLGESRDLIGRFPAASRVIREFCPPHILDA